MVMFRDSLYDAMTTLLHDRLDVPDVAEVLALEPDSRTRGCCETCEYTEVFVRISYRTTGGGMSTYDYLGDLGQLIRALTD